MSRLTDRHERILDDLRSTLENGDGEPWLDVVEDAMNTAWDALLAAGEPEENAPRPGPQGAPYERD